MPLTLNAILTLFIGGGLGTVFRHMTVLWAQKAWPEATFPRGVFVANLVGSFILGFLFALPALKARDSAAWLFFSTGFLGGYTTFSTLANDTFQLFNAGQIQTAFLNSCGSLVLGVLLAGLGWKMAQTLFS